MWNPFAPAPQQAPQQQQQSVTLPQTQPAGPADPFAKSPTQDPQQVQTAPLEDYKDLFTINKDAKTTEHDGNYITYNDEELAARVQNLQFLQGDEFATLADRATKGDAQALQQLLNKAVQTAYHQSAKLAANVSNSAVRGGVEHVSQTLPTQMRTQLAQTEIRAANPIMSNPAAAPMVAQIQAQFESKYPEATAKEIATMTSKYFTDLHQALTVKSPTNDPTSNISGNQDFTNFFGQGRR